ncbi:MAG: FkbM family methyltransferase [Nitrospira sp. LK70]|nr:FkbM family methyltransferase [Nitrospira sp. LK70]
MKSYAPWDAHRAALAELLSPFLDKFTIVDVGAHGTGEADVYAPALEAPNALVIGFEPNTEECARLNLQSAGRRRFFAHAIGNGRPGIFHVCRGPLTSSLLRPNTAVLDQYENLAELCEVTAEMPIDTVRLDDIGEIGAVDFLKLDIQGATLLALENAEQLLQQTLVVHAETEFVPIYTGEPLFSECELFLRQRGFMFHHFHSLEGLRMTPAGAHAVGRHPSQTLWADAVFVPSLERLARLSCRDLARLAWAMDAVYGACDLAMVCLRRCAENGGPYLAERYRSLLAEGGMLA